MYVTASTSTHGTAELAHLFLQQMMFTRLYRAGGDISFIRLCFLIAVWAKHTGSWRDLDFRAFISGSSQ